MANYSHFLVRLSTCIIILKIFKTFSTNYIDFYGIFFLCCLLRVFWLFENMILNDLRFDFHGHIENQSQIKSPYFNMI
jgi:hypothetical protein